MKRHSLFLSVLVVALLFSTLGCGGGSSPDAGDDGAEKPAKRFLSIGTAPTGGAFFVVGGALAEVADQFGKDQGWTVTAEATAGSQENIRRLISGELDFALANSAISYHAVRGEASWEQTYDVRTVMTLAPNIALFVSPSGSGVETISDLVGKRVVIGPAGAGFEMFVGPILEAHGVSYDDFTLLNAPQSGAVDLLSDGSAAAAFLGGAVPTASIVQASSSMDLHLVPYGEQEKAALQDRYPFFAPATIPADTYRGQAEAYHGLNVGSMHLITSADTDEEVVYLMTKILWENKDAVVERHPAGRAINPKVAPRYNGTDFHPGAIRFYKEIGIWSDPAENEAGTEEGSEEVVDGDVSES